MDTQPQFDLAARAQAWLQTLTHHGELTEGDAAELTDHLLTHYEAGLAAGLGESAAFEAAVAALGETKAIRSEYGKAHRGLQSMRMVLTLAMGLCASLTLWVLAWTFNTMVSGLGYLVDCPVAIMQVLMPISIVLSMLLVAAVIIFALAMPEKSLQMFRKAISKHRLSPIGIAALPWLGALYANVLMAFWFSDGSERWHVWDLMQFSDLQHDLFLLALAVGTVVGLGMRMLGKRKNVTALMGVGIAGIVLQPVVFEIANRLPEFGHWSELLPTGLLFLASIATAVLLRRTEKRRLWPA